MSKSTVFSWKSKFGNAAVFLVMLSMAGLLFCSGFPSFSEPDEMPVAVGFTLATVVFLAAAARAPFIGVSADETGIVVRALTGTKKYRWAEIVGIKLGPLTTSAAGAAGAVAPVLSVRRPGKPDQEVVLRELGSYGSTPGKKGLPQRAVEELNRGLRAWQSGQRRA